MSDNITLPREVVEEVLEALEHAGLNRGGIYTLQRTMLRTALAAPRLEVTVDPRLTAEEAAAISAALAAEQPKPEPVAWLRKDGIRYNCSIEPKDGSELPLYAVPPATHPGYVIGSHWLETAYSRICAGEAEADVLRDCGWRRCAVGQGLTQHCAEAEALRRDAERYKWLLDFLRKHGLLSLERCRIDSPASYGNWWILRKPKVIDGSSLIGYGKTEDAAIDAAMQENKR